MCGKGGSPTTTQTKTDSVQNQNVAYSPFGQGMFADIYNRANQASQAPYQPYTGQMVAGLSPDQQGAIGNIGANQNLAWPSVQQGLGAMGQGADITRGALPFFGQGAGEVGRLTDPQIKEYENPFTRDVINATMANINETNAQQQQQVLGNAAAQHALGGDRSAVAQAELARQQGLASNQTLANLWSQNYGQATQTALSQQQVEAANRNRELQAGSLIAGTGSQIANIGSGMGQLGMAGQDAAQRGSMNALQAGQVGQQNQQAQLTAQYQQYLQQLAFPYQQAQFLAGIGIPSAGAMGGQQFQTGQAGQVGAQSVTPPGMSWGQGIMGAGAIGAGLFSGYQPRSDAGQISYGGSGLPPAPSARGGRIDGYADGGSPYPPPDDAGGMPYPWELKAANFMQGIPGGGEAPKIDTPQSMIKPLATMTFPAPAQAPAQQSQSPGSTSDLMKFGETVAKAAPYALALLERGGGVRGYDGGGLVDDYSLLDDAPSARSAHPLVGAPISGESRSPMDEIRAAWPKVRDYWSPPRAAPAEVPSPLPPAPDPAAAPEGYFPKPEPRTVGSITVPPDIPPPAPSGGAPPSYFGEGPPPPAGIPGYYMNPGVERSDVRPRPPTGGLPTRTDVPTKGDRLPLATEIPAQEEDIETAIAGAGRGRGPAYPRPAGGRFDPATASASEFMNVKNFSGDLQKAGFLNLLKNPETRGEALVNMGLRILAAKPTSKSGVGEAASGVLGTMQDYDQFNKDSLTAAHKGQELALKLRSEFDKYSKMTPHDQAMLGIHRERLSREKYIPINYQTKDGEIVSASYDSKTGRYLGGDGRPLEGGRALGRSSAATGSLTPSQLLRAAEARAKNDPAYTTALGDPTKLREIVQKHAREISSIYGGSTTSPATAAPVVEPMPLDKSGLVAGKTYQTARGPATWDGAKFVTP